MNRRKNREAIEEVAAAKRREHEEELAKKRDMTAEERNRFDLANVKVKRNVQIDARTADGEEMNIHKEENAD